jgi:hypothetical protein
VWRPTGKFSALQSIENSQNAEGISILREPVPRAGRMPLASLAGIATRGGLTAKRSCPEMAPQRLEKIESAPGNGMGSGASNPQDVVHGARPTQRSLRPIQPLAKVVGRLGRDRCSIAAARPRRGKLSALQSLEKSRNGKMLAISLEGSAASPYPSTAAASTTRNCARSRPP